MKYRLSQILVFACVISLVPTVVFAAYNDVTLTTDAVISVGGYTLNVSGSNAAIQSIVVNSSSFSVTLASGSSFTVSSPTFNQLSSDVTSDIINNTCTGSSSSLSLAYSGGGTVTNVITPSATICSTSNSSSNSGGGGIISGSLSVGFVNTSTTSAPALTASSSTSFTSNSLATTTTVLPKLTTALKRGSVSVQVKLLQELLNKDPDTQVTLSGAGSPGQETSFFGPLTEVAVQKFQTKYGIVSSGTPATTGYGTVGPKTRAKFNTIF